MFACCVLAAATHAFALNPEVKDEAKLLKPQTVRQVNETLRQIKQRFSRDLVIETYPAVPDDLKPELNEKGKERFFDDWGARRGKELDVNGVIVVVCMEPRYFNVMVGNQTQKTAFTRADVDELKQLLLKRLRSNEFDQGMTEASDFVLRRMEKNMAGASTQPATRPAEAPGF